MAKAKRQFGPFEIEQKLGGGGMGVVYLATYLKTGQQCALKVLPPGLSNDQKLRARFTREMEILKRLRDKNIVRYFGGGIHEGQPFYAMEHIDGGTVEDLLVKRGRLGWEQTVEFARAICRGLEHAHSAGVIHRDLKPGNLFLTKQGELKLGDFGIAQDSQATRLTAPGSTVGTYAYMAPEQITGKTPVSRRTDLYALGCVMFEMLTGHTPFEADTMPDMLMSHLQFEPPRPTSMAPDCPVWLEALILKLLEKEPDDRYYDALAVQTALDDVTKRVAAQQSVAAATGVGAATSRGKGGKTRFGKTVAGSAGKSTVAGGKTVAAPGGPEVDPSTLKTRKKRKKFVPFYERVWFLSLCLVAVIGFIVWTLWPASAEELYQNAAELMAADDDTKWLTARDEYIEPLMERYPDSEYADEAQGWLDKIDMHFTESRLQKRIDRGLDPKSEAERRYVEARAFEQFGDLATAATRYGQLAALLQGREEKDEHALFLIGKTRSAELEKKWRQQGGQSAIGHVVEKLREAEGYFVSADTNRRLDAEKIWRAVANLYRLDATFADQVAFAEARLQNRPLDPPAWLTGEPGNATDAAPSNINE
jgi:serine/threonine-protein kinase